MTEIQQHDEVSASQSTTTKLLQSQIQLFEREKIDLIKQIEESKKSAEEIAFLKKKYEIETQQIEEEKNIAKLQVVQLQTKLEELQLQSPSPRHSQMDNSLLSELVETLPPTGESIQDMKGFVNFTAIQEKNLKIEEEKLKNRTRITEITSPY